MARTTNRRAASGKTEDEAPVDTAMPSEATGEAPSASPVAPPVEPPVETPVEATVEAPVEPLPPVAPAVRAASSGVGKLALTAALSGALGVGAALIALPYGLRGAPADTTLADRLAALESRPALSLDAVETRLTALETAPAPVTDLSPLQARLTALEGAAPNLTPLETRLAALESAPAPADTSELESRIARLETSLSASVEGQARAAVEAAFAAARTQAEQQAAALAAQQAQLAQTELRVNRQAALAELTAAAESGAAAPHALALLGDAPAALAPMAEGLVTLTALQDSFAPAARDALAAAPPPEDASLTDRLAGFLRAQTGARSLAPREGDDADAVLSRAEAALREGDLAATLTELGALTGAPAEAMAEWRATAQTRLDALAALATLNGG